MSILKEVLLFFEDLISGSLPFCVLIISGIILTLRGRFFQFKKLPKSVFLVGKAFKAPKNGGEINSFKAACTAISATVGTGNIVGVAGAIAIGGAGAVFWMWISALMGMAVKYGEISLAIIYRENKGEKFRGGPMYYIKEGMPKAFKITGPVFAFIAIFAVMVGGNMTQTNASLTSVSKNNGFLVFGGLLFCILTALITTGGIRRVGNVTEKLVPLMSFFYVIIALYIIFINREYIPIAFLKIIKGAFNPRAVTGGVISSIGTAMMIGASRGVFSNEAGLGTSAMAHSAAFDADSRIQGMFGIFEVFLDTIVLCTLTALTILCSGVNIEYGKYASIELVEQAFSVGIGVFSKPILALMMCVFGFSSVIGWAVYGDICTEYLFGEKGRYIFKFIYPLSCIVGALISSDTVWRMAGFLNGIMLCINVPAVLFLSNKYLKEDKNGRKNKKIAKWFR